MAIRYIEQDRTFWLDTEHTSYIMAVVDEENFVGHVYYGQKLQYTEGTPAPVYLCAPEKHLLFLPKITENVSLFWTLSLWSIRGTG